MKITEQHISEMVINAVRQHLSERAEEIIASQKPVEVKERELDFYRDRFVFFYAQILADILGKYHSGKLNRQNVNNVLSTFH